MTSFENICAENYPRIFRFILGMTGSKTTAEDITQEVFYIALKKGKDFQNHENPTAFLYTTAKYLVLEYFRNSQKEIPDTENNSILEDSSGDVFEQICKNREDIVEIEGYIPGILSALSSQEQLLYRKYYIEHIPMKQIARQQNISDAALRMKYMRLRRKVKNIVRQLKLADF